MKPVVLVSCVKRKQTTAARADDLYTSPLFQGMRAYARQAGSAWYILSALHGVLRPDQVVAPYERTLAAMTRPERAAWAERVLAQLRELLPPGVPVVMLAGLGYRRYLEGALRAWGHDVSVPMAGLRMGEQLRWLRARLGDR